MTRKLKIYLAVDYLFFVVFFLFLFRYYRYDVPFVEVAYFLFLLVAQSNISVFIMYAEDIFSQITLPILLPAMALIGPFWTAVIALLGTIKFSADVFQVWYKFVFNRALLFIAAGLAALVFEYSSNFFVSQYYFLAFFLASLTFFIFNNGLLYFAIKFSGAGNQNPNILYFIEISKNVLVSYFLGIFFYFAYLNFGKLSLILGILLIFVIKDMLYSKLQQLNSLTQLIESFLKVIDSKDHYTEGHCKRVANYTSIICKALNISRSRVERILNMAKIHDIGKIHVDDEILKKPDKLSDREYRQMQNHSKYGFELLKEIDLFKGTLEIILYHHEKYDGNGYPEGISGKDIPLGARILNLCDAFDVMTTGRSYKPALEREEVIQEIKDCSGKQFDPELVELMVRLIEKGEFDDAFNSKVKEQQDRLRRFLNN